MDQKKLGFGMMRLPITDKNNKGSIDVERTAGMVDMFMAAGFTYFDSAYMYHEFQSETVTGKTVVSRYPRDRFTVATKMPMGMFKTKEEQENIFNEQLKKCGVDYFDFYLIHNLNSSCIGTARELDTVGFLQKMKEEGKIRKLGFSCHDTGDFVDRTFNEFPQLEFVQLQINYLDWENEGIQSRKCYEAAVKHGKPVIVMEPVKGGTLANIPSEAEAALRKIHPDWSPASWAIRFAAGLPGVYMVLSGMSTEEQLADNIRTMQNFTPLDEKELAALETVRGIINGSIAIPCTGCRYCVEADRCPMNLNIPSYFALYNQEKLDTNPSWSSEKEMYANLLAEGYGKMEDCLHCGNCESYCPQHLPIRALLEKASDFFDAEGAGRTYTGEKITKSGRPF